MFLELNWLVWIIVIINLIPLMLLIYFLVRIYPAIEKSIKEDGLLSTMATVADLIALLPLLFITILLSIFIEEQIKKGIE